jgi:hypothetical protein
MRATIAKAARAQGAETSQPDRVRAHSSPPINRRIDVEVQQCLEHLADADRDDIARHLDTLNREWDVERYLQMNASLLSLTGVVLGAAVDRRFLVLPAVVFSFFFQHAVQGWCPPLPIFRRIGVRTRREINREKYALKALRGDFQDAGRPEAPGSGEGSLPPR